MLEIKYSPPEINRYLVSRQRVQQKLAKSLKSRLTVVTAPAGYGKTTAVLDWLTECGLPSAWLSLDVYDNNPRLFWQYVCRSLEGIAPSVSQDTEYIFSSRELLNANIHINILIDRLSKIPSDFLLVLEDLHFINDSSILKGLSYFIDYLPEKMHLILISRTEPELNLARYRIKSQLHRLDEKDLRFGEKEIFHFYQARGYTLENVEVKKVQSYSEGWAAALVVIAMFLEDTGAGDNSLGILPAGCREIDHYLKEEVFRLWRMEKQTFALKTCLLTTLTEELCDAVTGDGNARAMLREINEGGGFLIALDYQRQEYRFHHLFRTFLYNQLSETAPAEISELHSRAAHWYRSHGFMQEAMEHLLAGGLFQEAFAMIEHEVDYLIHRNDFGTLLSWARRLPAEYRDKSFKIAAIYAVYYAENGRYDLSRQWVGRMKALKDSNHYTAEPELNEYFTTAGLLVEANLLIREGNTDYLPLLFGAEKINTGGAYKISEYNDFNTADIYFYRSPINILTNLMKEDADKYKKMTEIYRGIIAKNPGYAPLCTGEYLYENNRPEEALPFLLKALEEAREARCPGALVPAMVDIARIKRAQGDMAGAFRVIAECEEQLREYNKAHWVYLLQAFRCRLYLDIGDREKIQEWYEAKKPTLFAEINKINEFELIVCARVFMALNRANDAGLLLQRLLAFTGDHKRLHSRVEILNLLALLAYHKNHTKMAYRYLDESLDIGRQEGLVRNFLDELSPLARMLRSYLKSRWKLPDDSAERRAYARSLLKQMPESLLKTLEGGSVVAEEVTERIFEQLTAQEKKVLALLANAATNQEIGEKLGISLRTVKAHTGNIYSKLGLKNRAQCVRLVRELGLM